MGNANTNRQITSKSAKKKKKHDKDGTRYLLTDKNEQDDLVKFDENPLNGKNEFIKYINSIEFLQMRYNAFRHQPFGFCKSLQSHFESSE